MKRYGFSDKRLGELTGRGEREIRALRIEHDVLPVYKAVDTCAAEFQAETPYFYSTYEEENEAAPGDKERVVILGSGPNRIGQGIEFDYCCVHAALTAREQGFEAVMVNCNPETVSTDYDISDRLYFEPLTFEDVANIVANERPKGVIVQFGGQTPLKIAGALAEAGIPILGTPQESIDLAEDRGRFGALLEELGIQLPEYGLATTAAQAAEVAARVGYPLLVRPSYVLGGRAMQIVYGPQELEHYMADGRQHQPRAPGAHRQVPGGRDRGRRGRRLRRRGRLHRRRHAARGGGRRPLRRLRLRHPVDLARRGHARAGAQADAALALGLGVSGLINVQFAYQSYQLYVLEVNPRGSRTVPFVSKATGVPHGADRHARDPRRALEDMGLERRVPEYVSVKEAVLPFSRFPGSDTQLGPEMKSTGEVMGIAEAFPAAFGKAVAAAGMPLPTEGNVFLSVCDSDKSAATILAQRLQCSGSPSTPPEARPRRSPASASPSTW